MTDIGDGLSTDILARFEDVVRVLGGPGRVAALTQRSRSSVWNWSKDGQFPATYYHLIRDACALHGYRVDQRLFAFASYEKMPVAVVVAA